jgi:2-oxoisovalerate dehydrogenase E2 component (dihydrolipoyl transacylase)
MSKEFKLPDIGEGVAEGEIRKWLIKEGDEVKEFQPIAEIMTDKVNIEMTSPFSGKVLKLAAKEGEVVKVGQTILVYEESGSAGAVHERGAVEKHAPAVQEGHEASHPPAIQSEVTLRATPAVRKRARELGVDLTHIVPSDPSGRITLEDVERAASQKTKPAMPMEKERVEVTSGEERVPVEGIRRKIFEKMTLSKQKIPHFNYTDEVDMTSIVEARELFSKKMEGKLTYLPFIIKALIAALSEYPKLNATYDEKTNEIVLKRYYNIGIAVATEQGLIVPVIHDADKKGLKELSEEIEQLATKARSGKLSLNEVQGGTFTITNVGPIGGLFSSPVINYPEVAILATHKIEKRPVVRDGSLVIRDMMYFTLACDHRIIDGAEAASFGNRLKEFLEHPYLLRLV